MLTRWLSRGARRMLGELPPEPPEPFNKAVAGRNASASTFDIDVVERDEALADRAGLRIERARARRAAVGRRGARRRRRQGDAARVADAGRGAGPAAPAGRRRPRTTAGRSRAPAVAPRLRHRRPRLHAVPRQHRARQPAQRDRLDAQSGGAVLRVRQPSPTWIACCRRRRSRRCPRRRRSRPPPKPSTACSCTRSAARPRLPNAASRRARSPIPLSAGRPSADGLADLLWALMMKPEFQLIY